MSNETKIVNTLQIFSNETLKVKIRGQLIKKAMQQESTNKG